MIEAGQDKKLRNLTAIIGNPSDPVITDKTTPLGKCAKEFSNVGTSAPGCPPKERDMIRALCEACAADYDLVIATRNELRRNLWESFIPS